MKRIETKKDLEQLSKNCPVEVLLAGTEKHFDKPVVEVGIFLEKTSGGFSIMAPILGNGHPQIGRVNYQFDENFNKGVIEESSDFPFEEGTKDYQEIYNKIAEAFCNEN